MKVLIIDNYDSFTFNLYQLTGEVLYEEFSNEINDVIVKRNDEVSLSEIKKNNFDKIIISPGPGSPVDDSYFGICKEVIKELGNEKIPILGICLGMQGIVHVLGVKLYMLNLQCMENLLSLFTMKKEFMLRSLKELKS